MYYVLYSDSEDTYLLALHVRVLCLVSPQFLQRRKAIRADLWFSI